MIGSHIGHIRLDAVLGAGGMGTVYRGFDEALERTVAVKALREHRRLGTEAKARFLSEARILSRLDHPGICRIFDLVSDQDSDYLILEYVPGRTLSQAAADDLDLESKLSVAEQVAEALAAAHRAKIVHRDLKPDNIMVSADLEVKVLDFGLARPVKKELPEPGPGADPTDTAPPRAVDVAPEAPRTSPSDGSRPTVDTVLGSVLGTIRYMSPEQAAGEPVSEASDLYSLGIVLHELFTGSRAYEQLPPVALLLKVQEAESLPVAGLGADLTRLIEELESLDPTRRPPASEVARRLRHVRDTPMIRRRRRTRFGIVAALAAVMIATAAMSYRLGRHRPMLAEGEVGRLAVLPFVNATGDSALQWVEEGLMRMVADTLDGATGIEVAPVDEVLAATRAVSGDTFRELNPDETRRVSAAVGGNVVVQTSILSHGTRYEVLYAVHLPGRDLVRKSFMAQELTDAANQLARRVALRVDPHAQTVEISDRFSEDPFANRTYAAGLQRSETAGSRSARHFFEVCLDLDPDFVRARLKLAQSLHKLGEWQESHRLTSAVLATARTRTDHRLIGEALRTLAVGHHDRGEYTRSDELLLEALTHHQQLGDLYGLTETLNNLGSNAYRRGDLDRAEEHWTNVLDHARSLGFHKRIASVLNNLGAIAYSRGDPDTAALLWEDALQSMRAMGNLNLQGLTLGNLAVVETDRGNLDRAEAFEREALAIHRAAGDRRSEITALFNLAETLRLRGDNHSAMELALEGLAMAQELGDRLQEAHFVAALAYLATRDGDLQRAQGLLDHGRTLARDLQSREIDLQVSRAMAYLLITRGDLDDADSYLTRAEAIDPDAGEVKRLRARLCYERGDFATATTAAEAARRDAAVWTAEMERELEVYRNAARLGRRITLPDDNPESGGRRRGTVR